MEHVVTMNLGPGVEISVHRIDACQLQIQWGDLVFEIKDVAEELSVDAALQYLGDLAKHLQSGTIANDIATAASKGP